MIRARAYAKVNLYLAVVDRRADGYHDIETILQSIDLADELTVEVAPELAVTCSIPELSGPANLCHGAAEALKATAGVSKGARIHIEKRIPVAAGLAGGSADAAATLIALDKLWGLGAPDDLLASVGARIGSDVPFCLRGGTVLGTGRGTELSPIHPLRGLFFVLGKPPGTLSAGDVYERFDANPISPKRSAVALRSFLDAGDPEGVCSLLENTLEPTVLDLMPEVAAIRDAALRAGARCALVSGSGPAVFAVTESRREAALVAEGLKAGCELVHIGLATERGVELLRD